MNASFFDFKAGLTAAILVLLASALSAQTTALTAKPVYRYGEVIGRFEGYNDFAVRIDTGQVEEIDNRGRPTDGSEKYPYRSMVRAMNILSAQGWELEEKWVVKTRETLYGVRWLVKRELGQNESPSQE